MKLRRRFALALALSMAVGTTIYATEPSDITSVAVNMGTNKSQLIFTWTSTDPSDGYIQVRKDGEIIAEAAVAGTNQTINKASSRYSFNSTVDVFDTAGVYEYRVGNVGSTSTEWTELTILPDDGDFSFLVFGDTQFYDTQVEADSAQWEITWNKIEEFFDTDDDGNIYNDVDFLITVGDQINGNRLSGTGEYVDSVSDDDIENQLNNEIEYDIFFSAKQIGQMPLAVCTGNHDVYTTTTHSSHFTYPSTQDPNTSGYVASSSSYWYDTDDRNNVGNYWYEYEGSLFLHLNSEMYADTALHYAFIENAQHEFEQQYGHEPVWQIVYFHRALYATSQNHSAGSTATYIRENWSHMFSDLNIDLVLNGHEHIYSRSVMMQGTTPTYYGTDHSADYELQSVVSDPNAGEVAYVTLSSSTGSKFYDYHSDYQTYPYVAITSSDHVAQVTKVDVSDTSLTLSTYRTGENNTIEDMIDQFTIERTAPYSSLQKGVVSYDYSPIVLEVEPQFSVQVNVSVDDVEQKLKSAVTTASGFLAESGLGGTTVNLIKDVEVDCDFDCDNPVARTYEVTYTLTVGDTSLVAISHIDIAVVEFVDDYGSAVSTYPDGTVINTTVSDTGAVSAVVELATEGEYKTLLLPIDTSELSITDVAAAVINGEDDFDVISDSFVTADGLRFTIHESGTIKVIDNDTNVVESDLWFSNGVKFVMSRELFDDELVLADNVCVQTVFEALTKYCGKSDFAFDGDFDSDADCTREQIATVLYVYANGDVADDSVIAGFDDCDDISAAAKDAMVWAVSEGLLQGDTNNLLSPTAAATGYELATILYRFFNMLG